MDGGIKNPASDEAWRDCKGVDYPGAYSVARAELSVALGRSAAEALALSGW